MKVPTKWWVEPVQIETFTGTSSYGPVYAPIRTVKGQTDMTRKAVLTATGVEVISEMTLRFPPELESVFTPESRITAAGRFVTVLTVKPYTLRGKTVYVEVTTT